MTNRRTGDPTRPTNGQVDRAAAEADLRRSTLVHPAARTLPSGDPVIALSPHLDDAVLSCGGSLALAAAEGREVIVATFCTQAPDRDGLPRRFRAFSDMEGRRAEDHRALAHLGACPRWLGFVERAFQEPMLRGRLSVFRTPSQTGLAGFPEVQDHAAAIRGLFDEYPGALMLAPLGVGNHYDHVQVFLASLVAALDLASDPSDREAGLSRMLFYEDAYAVSTGMRRRHFVAGRIRLPRRLAPQWANWMSPLQCLVLSSSQRGPRVDTYLPARARDLEWACRPMGMAACEETKFQAIALYPSQMRAMGGMTVWRKMLSRQHVYFGGAHLGGAQLGDGAGRAEPFWSAGPPPEAAA